MADGSRAGVGSIGVGSMVLGRWEVVERLGAGGFGVVWRARDTVLGRQVALKHVPVGDGSDPDDGTAGDDRRARALREGRALGRIVHPSVVTIHDMVDDPDGAVWLILEYVPGAGLDEEIARDGRWSPARTAGLGAVLADALAHGHELDLIHRDVKPANVLVGSQGDRDLVKLADYGIARLADDDHVTTAGQRFGSLPWASPEWARNEEVTAASDVFSLGATLFHAVEGHSPFRPEEPGRALVLEVAGGRVLPAHHAGPLAELLATMLDPEPSARPDAADVARRLAAISEAATEGDADHSTAAAPSSVAGVRPQAGSDLVPSGADPPARSGHRPRRWRTWPVVTGAAVVVALALAGVLWLTLSGGPADDPLTLPATLDLVGFSGNERDVDPCTVVDPQSLAVFGSVTTTPGPYFSSCTATIRKPGAAGEMRIVTDVFRGSDSAGDPAARRPLGAGFVVTRPDSDGCRHTVTLATDISIGLRTTSKDPAVDACRLGDAAVALTVRGLNAHGFVTVPGRASGWPLAVADACTLATRESLDPVGLGEQRDAPQSTGWGRWDCSWGRDVQDTPLVQLTMRLEPDYDALGRGPLGLVAGRTVVTEIGSGDQNPQLCTSAVLWRPVARPAGLFQVIEARVEGPFDTPRLCDAGRRIVTTAADLLDARR